MEALHDTYHSFRYSDLLDDTRSVVADPVFRAFFTALSGQTIHLMDHPNFDITPVMAYHRFVQRRNSAGSCRSAAFSVPPALPALTTAARLPAPPASASSSSHQRRSATGHVSNASLTSSQMPTRYCTWSKRITRIAPYSHHPMPHGSSRDG